MRKSAKILLLVVFVAAEASIAVAQSSGGSGGGDDRLICRRTPETGSLVKAKRECFTKAQWDRIAESQRIGANRMIQELTTKQSGE